MRKSLSILFINLCLLIVTAQAQDSVKTTTPASRAKTPAASPPSPATSKVAQPAPAEPAKSSATTSPASSRSTVPATQQKRVIAAAQPVDKSISGQYEDLLKYSWMQQGYKVINPARLTTLWKSVNDSLSVTANQLSEAKTKIALQEKQLAELKNQTSQKAAGVQASTQPTTQIKILGMLIDLSTYNWIMLGLIVSLAIALAIVSFSISKNSNDSKYYKQQVNELTEEYHAYKVKTNDKEKRLARELQTERNTLEDLREELANKKQ